jgi:hypothetical protein
MSSQIPERSPCEHQIFPKWYVESNPLFAGPLNDQENKTTTRKTLAKTDDCRKENRVLRVFGLNELRLRDPESML